MNYIEAVRNRSRLCRMNKRRTARIIPFAVEAVKAGGSRSGMIARVRNDMNVGSWSVILSALIPIVIDIIRDMIERRRGREYA